MDFFKTRRFGRAHKPNPENNSDDKPVPHPDEPRMNMDELQKFTKVDTESHEIDDDEDDDFITNEVKRRLQDLRRNSFMVLIPEETENEEEEEEECEEEDTKSVSEHREVEVANYRLFWCDFDTFYRSYCERMLLFDRISVQLLKEAGTYSIHTHFSSLWFCC